MFGFGKPTSMVSADEALPGRSTALPDVPDRHAVLDASLHPPFAPGVEVLYVAMGCFWGAERIFWKLPGVVSTAVGYTGGFTANPTYEETCTGRTGHTEAVMVAYDPTVTDAEHLLKAFWENHDPTTENRQGNDVGTQYRSAIYWTTERQRRAAEATRAAFQAELDSRGYGPIATEIRPFSAETPDGASAAGPFYYAEGYHQQYLHKNPGGYCNHGPNGLTCPVGLLKQDELPSQESVLRGE